VDTDTARQVACCLISFMQEIRKTYTAYSSQTAAALSNDSCCTKGPASAVCSCACLGGQIGAKFERYDPLTACYDSALRWLHCMRVTLALVGKTVGSSLSTATPVEARLKQPVPPWCCGTSLPDPTHQHTHASARRCIPTTHTARTHACTVHGRALAGYKTSHQCFRDSCGKI
jgi:hypothetical protein